MANIAFLGMAVTYSALLSCVSHTSTGLSKHGVGVEPLCYLDSWDCRRLAQGGGGGGLADNNWMNFPSSSRKLSIFTKCS